jgi:hypothetical protein
VGKQHFRADKHQHNRQAGLQVMEKVKRPRQHEIERTQAEDGKHVGGVNNERVQCDAKDGRD